MNKPLIIGTTLVATIIGATVVTLDLQSRDKPAQTTSNLSKEVTMTEAVPTPQEAPVETVQVATTQEAAVETTSTPAPAPQSQPESQTYKWQAEMAAAGIAESDYQYVTDLVLDENGWRTAWGHEYGLWRSAAAIDRSSGDLAKKIALANAQIPRAYGSWQVAHETNRGVPQW